VELLYGKMVNIKLFIEEIGCEDRKGGVIRPRNKKW